MQARENVDLLILFVEETFQFPHFGFQCPYAVLQRLCIASREGTTAELVARAALEADVGTLGAAGPDAIAANLFTSTSIAGLGNAALGAVAHADHLHRDNARHCGGGSSDRGRRQHLSRPLRPDTCEEKKKKSRLRWMRVRVSGSRLSDHNSAVVMYSVVAECK